MADTQRAIAATVTVLLALLWPAAGRAGQPHELLDDAQLSDTAARDGLLVLGLANLKLSSLEYSDGASTMRLQDMSASSTGLLGIRVLSRAGGSDYISFESPAGVPTRWQLTSDTYIHADGTERWLGQWALQDLTLSGGGLQLSTGPTGGFVWGSAFRMDLGQWRWRARSAADGTEELAVSGVHLGSASVAGGAPDQPWALSDISRQPGRFDFAVASDGQLAPRLWIDWPSQGNSAPSATLLIDKVQFRSDNTGTLDLGSSRIASLQLQHLDVRFRP